MNIKTRFKNSTVDPGMKPRKTVSFKNDVILDIRTLEINDIKKYAAIKWVRQSMILLMNSRTTSQKKEANEREASIRVTNGKNDEIHSVWALIVTRNL